MTETTIDRLAAGATYFFAATAFDSIGNESVFSSEVTYTLPTINTPPTISSIAAQTTYQASSTPALTFTVGDAQTPAGSLVVSVASSNPTLVPNSNIVVGGSGANRTVTVTPAVGQVGNATITLTVSDGSLSASTSFALTVNALPTNGLNFAASSGGISPPFTVSDGAVSQSVRTGLTDGGAAVYSFAVTTAGDYMVSMLVNAPDEGANSMFVNIDAEPMDPASVWDVPVTSGFTNLTVAWRGTGTDSREMGRKVFTLAAGTHQLIVRGREANLQFRAITVTPLLAPNTAPTISAVGNQSIYQDGSTAALGFSVGDAETTAANLVVSAGSSNPALVPVSNIVLGGTGSSRTVTVRPTAGQTGTATVTLTVSDGGKVASTDFVVTVNAVTLNGLSFAAAAGSISSPLVLSNGIVSQPIRTGLTGSGRAAYYFTVTTAGDYVVSMLVNAPDEGANSMFVNIDAEPLDPASVWDVPVTSGFTNLMVAWRGNSFDSREMQRKVFTLAAGTHQLIVRGREANTQFRAITVTPLLAPNTLPTITAIGNQSIDQDQSTAALGFSVGDAETEPGSLAVTAGSSNPTLVPVSNIALGGSGSSRTVTVRPGAGQIGTTTISLTVSDGALSASTRFEVTVLAVNSAPTISAISDQSIYQDGATAALGFSVGDAETAAGSLAVTAESSDPMLVPVSNIVLSGSGVYRTVIVTPNTGRSGNATITLTVSDGSLTGRTSFALTVLPNTPPTISSIAAQVVFQNTSTPALTFSVGDGQTPAANLTVSAASSNPRLVPDGNISLSGSGTYRTVTVTPATGQSGSANITLSVSDGSLSASTSFGLTVNSLPTNGLSFTASSGAVSSPFSISNGVVSQPVRTGLTAGGAAVYDFTVPTAGDYTVSMQVSAPDEGANSLFVNIDAEPVDPAMVWDVPVTRGFTNLTVGWRGDGFDSRESGPKVFTLTTGSHRLVVRGREANTQFSFVTLTLISPANTPPTISSIAAQTIYQNTSTDVLGFNVADAQTPAASLTVSASSSNPTLVPSGNIVLGGNGSNRTVAVTPAAGQLGTAIITLSVSDGALSASNSFLVTVNLQPPSEIKLAASSGGITAPFAVSNGVVSQPVRTGLSGSGAAVYDFLVATAGDYIVSMLVSAPDEGANSLFVNIDAEPVDPTMIWDVPVSQGFANFPVSWRGTGVDSRESGPTVFTLTAGAHRLVVRGREANTQFEAISIMPVANGAVTASAAPLITSFGSERPMLSITPFGGGLVIAWPSSATGWILEEAQDFGSSTWTPVSATPEDDGTTKSLFVSPIGEKGFYRLNRP